MNNSYSEVREYLRQEHAKNVNELYGKNAVSHYGTKEYKNVQANRDEVVPWTFSFKLKVLLFLSCVILFSLYIYGGQDVKKGAVMAYGDVKNQVLLLEEKEPAVKNAMNKARGIYHSVNDYLSEFATTDGGAEN